MPEPENGKESKNYPENLFFFKIYRQFKALWQKVWCDVQMVGEKQGMQCKNVLPEGFVQNVVLEEQNK